MKNRIQCEILVRLLNYDNFTVSGKSEEKWLETFCRVAGLKSVIEDLRMQMIEGIKCGHDIWEMALIPSLLNNAAPGPTFRNNR